MDEQGNAGVSTMKLDAEAATLVDGWKDLRPNGGGLPTGQPPKGLRRPIIRYSNDLWRASLLARKACKKTGASVSIQIDGDEIIVSGELKGRSGVTLRGERTSGIAEMLTKVSIALCR